MIRAGADERPSKRTERLQALAQLRGQTERASAAFLERHEAEVERYRREISIGVVAALERLSRDVGEITGNNPLNVELMQQASDYIEWLQWSFWDLPYIAVALEPDAEEFRGAVAACGMVYL
jgi:hypothetical protein